MIEFLFLKPWPWWAAGMGLGAVGVGLAAFLGRRLGVTGGVADACAVAARQVRGIPWTVWFLLGLPLGGVLSHAAWWHWHWLYGRMDALTAGSFGVKAFLLFLGGGMIGYGARWAGGCTAGHSLMGMGLLRVGSFLNTLVFLAAGAATANLIWRVVVS